MLDVRSVKLEALAVRVWERCRFSSTFDDGVLLVRCELKACLIIAENAQNGHVPLNHSAWNPFKATSNMLPAQQPLFVDF